MDENQKLALTKQAVHWDIFWVLVTKQGSDSSKDLTESYKRKNVAGLLEYRLMTDVPYFYKNITLMSDFRKFIKNISLVKKL